MGRAATPAALVLLAAPGCARTTAQRLESQICACRGAVAAHAAVVRQLARAAHRTAPAVVGVMRGRCLERRSVEPGRQAGQGTKIARGGPETDAVPAQLEATQGGNGIRPRNVGDAQTIPRTLCGLDDARVEGG